LLYVFIQINIQKDYKMSRPQRSLRLQRRSSNSLNVLSGAAGELFFDTDIGALRLYTSNNNDRRTLADRTWVANNTFDGDYNSLTNRPTIPTVDGLATETYVDTALLDKQNTAYTPGTVSDWDGTAPTSIVEAIDRLAAVVKVLNGGVGA
jgi:hypothetical protein